LKGLAILALPSIQMNTYEVLEKHKYLVRDAWLEGSGYIFTEEYVRSS